MNQGVQIIEKDKSFVSYMYVKHDKKYFLILELESNDELNVCEEIFKTHASNLINSIDTNQFNHILHDIYTQIKNYAELDEQGLFFYAFSNKTRANIFQLLRSAIISKSDLAEELYEKYKLKPENIEIYLTPFLRLNLIVVEDLPGLKNNIFFVRDCFLGQYPFSSVKNIKDKELLNLYLDYYKSEHIIPDEIVTDICTFLSDKNIKAVLNQLKETPLSASELVEKFNIKDSTIEKLIRNQVIFRYNDLLHLYGEFRFVKFKPTYIINELKKRWQSGFLSLDQMVRQIELILETTF